MADDSTADGSLLLQENRENRENSVKQENVADLASCWSFSTTDSGLLEQLLIHQRHVSHQHLNAPQQQNQPAGRRRAASPCHLKTFTSSPALMEALEALLSDFELEHLKAAFSVNTHSFYRSRAEDNSSTAAH
ncbi:uncharacterized protein V6R79_022323 [Siganus canaliculatus]